MDEYHRCRGRRSKGRVACGVRQVLIQWTNKVASAATWEDEAEFRRRCPAFQLEDELFPKVGRDVVVGIVYNRRKKTQEKEAA